MLGNWARAAGFAALLMVTLGGSLFWAFGDSLQSPTECRAESQEASDQKYNLDNNTSVSHLLPPQYNRQQSVKTDHYYECLLADYTHQLAIFTKVLAAATAILAIVTFVFAWLQFRDTRI